MEWFLAPLLFYPVFSVTAVAVLHQDIGSARYHAVLQLDESPDGITHCGD
jgi:hypothetical protein